MGYRPTALREHAEAGSRPGGHRNESPWIDLIRQADPMSMIVPEIPAVETAGAALAAALLAEAWLALEAVLALPAMRPEETAAVLDRATDRSLDEVTLSVLVHVLAR